MRLARLTNLEADKLQAEYDTLQERIAYYKLLLSDRPKLMEVIKEEILAIRNRFADERRTAISPIEGEIDIEDLIPKDSMVVTMTHFGYVKRLPQSTYRSQNRGGKGIIGMSTRDEDYVERMYIVHSHSDMLYFTDRGRAYGLKCYEIPEASRTARGTAIVNLLQLEGGEKVNGMLPIPDRDSDEMLLMATKQGRIKKTALSEFSNLRNAGIIAINLVDDDELIGVELTDGNQEIMIATKKGKSIRFSETEVRMMGRNTQGVKSIELDEGDEVISLAIVEEDKQVLCITEKGYGKRTLIDEYRLQSRGGKGVAVMKLSKKTGDLASVLMVSEEDELMLITDDGTIIRTPITDVRIMGRTTQGVRLMRVADDAVIVDVDIVAEEDDDDHVHEYEHLPAPFDDIEEEADTEDNEEDF